MTAQEVRMFRNICKKLTEVEQRTKLLEELRRKNVCLSEEEWFVQKTFNKCKTLGNKKGFVKKHREEMVNMSLKVKIKDNNLYGVKLRKKRNWLRSRLENTMGSKSPELKKILSEIKELSAKQRDRLKKKHKNKVIHLVKKFGQNSKDLVNWNEVDKEIRDLVGNPKIFGGEEIKSDEIKDPVIITGLDENITLSNEEIELLKLGPKFCVLKDLNDEEFETDIEECIMAMSL